MLNVLDISLKGIFKVNPIHYVFYSLQTGIKCYIIFEDIMHLTGLTVIVMKDFNYNLQLGFHYI